ncbi:hypothetical protein CkaCkLH20_01373 [Colletotrichum karsti]|uniref:DUF6594 domain-containing protein n=1 Tax=Colletotrichum karsti TaxID=1095194 RepID=A0A9P6IE80_9PEZI|nr:uncharacterized protein CkaCkLH20_01373 [Colletotrichum karsti]KAF9881223.1 hypothetical protein CkaCkLH20_01373 [Colletotrichum karsti]
MTLQLQTRPDGTADSSPGSQPGHSIHGFNGKLLAHQPRKQTPKENRSKENRSKENWSKKNWSKDQGAMATERYPKGWPRLAAEQDAYENASIYRKFGYVSRRCILDAQAKLTSLEKHLFNLERPPLLDDTSTPVPSSSSVQVSTISGENTLPATASETLQSIGSLLPEYHQMLFNLRTLESFHEVRYYEHINWYDKITADDYLSKEELAYMNHVNDFVNTGPDPLWLAFESLLYRLPYSFRKLIFGHRDDTKRLRNFILLPMLHLRILYKTIFIWFYAFLLLLPVALLYLHPGWSKQAVIGLVAGFTVFFTASLTLHRGISMQTTLIGACTYAAVLVALFAELQDTSATG